MAEYNFNFNIDTTKMIRVSIMRLGIIFNAETIKTLGSPRKINIGIDVDKKVLAIRKSNNSNDTKEYQFAKTGKEKWIRVNSVRLVRTIENIINTKFSNKAVPFQAEYSYDLDMLIVNLKKEK